MVKNIDSDFMMFASKIMKGVENVEISLDKIVLDEEARKIVNSASPIAGLRSQADFSQTNSNLVNIILLQSPIVCYPYRNKYKLIGGFFTYCKLFNITQPDHVVRVTVILKKPSEQNRRLFFLQDLTRALLTEGFINESVEIKTYLEAWFKKDPQRRSIYQSSEWQTLFPKLKTMKAVANWLNISRKMLSLGKRQLDKTQ